MTSFRFFNCSLRIMLLLIMISFALAATADTFKLEYKKQYSTSITTTPGTHTFVVNGIYFVSPFEPDRITEWYRNGTYTGTSNNDKSVWPSWVDPSYTTSMSSGNSYIIEAVMYNDQWQVENKYKWTITIKSPNRLPSQPGSLSASSVTESSARVSWGASSDADGDRLEYYLEYKKDFSWTWQSAGSTTGTSKTISGLTPNTMYDVKVRAYDGQGFGSWRDQENVIKTRQKSYTITTGSSPSSGGTTNGGGIYYDGSSCTVRASASSGYSFVKWTENGSKVSPSSSYTFTVRGTRFLVANYARRYTISTSSSPSAGGTTSGGGTFTSGSTCTVEATAKSDYNFDRWTEAGVGVGVRVNTQTSYSFMVDRNRQLVALFIKKNQPPSQPGTIAASNITKNSARVSWGASTDPDGDSLTYTVQYKKDFAWTWQSAGSTPYTSKTIFNLEPKTTYDVRVQASDGKLSSSWRDQENVITTSLNSFTVTVIVSPPGSGTVIGGGTYNQGIAITLKAIPNSGYKFLRWTENGTQVSTSSSLTLTVGRDRSFVANFVKVTEYNIATSSSPTNGGSTTGGGSFNSGSTCTVRATPNSDYTFSKWTENGTQVNTSASYSFEVDRNRSLVANFTGGSIAASRVLPNTYSKQQLITVTINVDLPQDAKNLTAEDTIPVGWSVVSNISNAGEFDSAKRKVKWTILSNPPTKLTYNIMAPDNSEDDVVWGDGIILSGNNSATISGDNSIIYEEYSPHPADKDGGMNIDIYEVHNFIVDWLDGVHDDIFMTHRAIYIWQNGEQYEHCSSHSTGYCPIEGKALLKVSQILTATRELPECYESGIPFDIKINVSLPTGYRNLTAEDQIPEGWIASDISNSGKFDENTHKVRWAITSDPPEILSYSVTPSIESLEVATFSGIVLSEQENAMIGGDSSVSSCDTINIQITPSTSNLLVNKTNLFTATVTGTENTAVTWYVNDIEGGNGTVGTISEAGLYTAPAIVPVPPQVLVKAVSQADPSVFATATITISTTPPTSSFALWRLDGQGGVDKVPSDSVALPNLPSEVFSQDDTYRDLVATHDNSVAVNGYYILDQNGQVYPHGGATDYTSINDVFFGWDIARRVTVAVDGSKNDNQAGLYLLDGYGGVHLLGPEQPENYFKTYRNNNGGYPYFGWDIARAMANSKISIGSGENSYTRTNGYYILDGFGGVHWCIEDESGNSISAPWAGEAQPYFGWDIARDLQLTPDGNGYLMLDGYGNLHAVGETNFTFAPEELALNLGGGGNDLAVQFELVENGNGEIEGLYVLDKFGEIHEVGNVPDLSATVFSEPKAKALAGSSSP